MRAVASVVDEAFVRPGADGPIGYLCPLRGGLAYLPSDVDDVDVEHFDPESSAPSRAGTRVTVLGDTVARGVVLEAAVREHLSVRAPGESWRLVVHGFLATAGIARLVALLDSYRPEQRPAELVVVAYEALFDAAARERRKVRRPGLPPRRHPVHAAYEALLASSPGLCLEKSAVYDTGDRAFAPEHHETGRRAHWDVLAEMDDAALAIESARRSGRRFADEQLRSCLARVS